MHQSLGIPSQHLSPLNSGTSLCTGHQASPVPATRKHSALLAGVWEEEEIALLADGALLFAGYFQFGTLEARNVTAPPGLWCCDEMPAPAKSTVWLIQAWGLTERLISPSISWLWGIVSGGWFSVRPHAACAPPAEGAASVLCFRDKGPVRQWRAGWIQDKSSCHTVTALSFT